ncbi:AAA family ATPase [Saccharopolyspora hirsuta]|uniref:AAA family ATPase n=1 Tax=Saccharopolyspora hirsuta TaxID=1837 RepID=UPI00331FB060
MLDRAILLITGIQAAGKSTIAQGIAERLPRSVHLRGDTFRRMVVGGREEMSGAPSDEALRQLRLRYRLTAQTADAYFAEGFAVVAQDVVLGEHLAELVEQVRSRPLLVVVLAPDVEAIAEREAGRGKSAYGTWAIAELNEVLHEQTPRLGLWLDTSDQTPEQTVEEILRRWPEAVV